MTAYRRHHAPHGLYFFTLTLQNRRHDWLVRHVDLLRAAYRETLLHYPFETVAIVILPEHLHLIMQLPDGEDDYSRRLQVLKSNFSKRLPEFCRKPNASQAKKGELGIWQRRFWEHAIRDDEDLQRHVFYTYYNPVKHGHVPRVADWPYSSFHRDVRRDLFAPDWGGELPAFVTELYDE